MDIPTLSLGELLRLEILNTDTFNGLIEVRKIVVINDFAIGRYCRHCLVMLCLGIL